MPTTLSPTEQLSAAQNQLNNWKLQQQALGNSVTITDINNQMGAILNSGAYPDLSMGRLNSGGETSQGLVVNIAPDSFFVQGSGPTTDTNYYNGTPLLNDTGLVINADNAAQVAAAQDAANSAQILAQQSATQQSAQQLSDAQAALRSEEHTSELQSH